MIRFRAVEEKKNEKKEKKFSVSWIKFVVLDE
jgi:hypothetical protein